MTKLLIKYHDSYVCERFRNEIDFITVPMYYPSNEVFSNISIFITLFATNNLSQDYSSNERLDEIEWKALFEEYFVPEYLLQVGKEIYIYDLDNFLKDYPDCESHYVKIISELRFPLTIKPFKELKNSGEVINTLEEQKYDWRYPVITVNADLELFISKRHVEKSENDCLLLYSGGKDSTLAAIRLRNAGYNVHFIHFNNGYMRDQDKPYLTFQELFYKDEHFYFDYELSDINIQNLFEEYFSKWSNDLLTDSELISEVRCLSCRVAMYTKAIQIAKECGYKYIAEGARISQKFMLEQLPLINRLRKLAVSQGLELLFPVLYVDDDQKEIEELIDNGYSSKTWESKCLIGRPAKDKSVEDEEKLLRYFDDVLELTVKKKLKDSCENK